MKNLLRAIGATLHQVLFGLRYELKRSMITTSLIIIGEGMATRDVLVDPIQKWLDQEKIMYGSHIRKGYLTFWSKRDYIHFIMKWDQHYE